MKKIGFIDYYISEWHANNYPIWIKEANEKLGEDFVISYVWAEQEISPLDGVSTDKWCQEFGVEKCTTIEELCEKSDYILILAPSNPEKHLGYAKVALKYGKNTYIDKTFAPDLKTSEEIFDLAKKYGTKFFSSSALRFASELDGKEGSKSIITTSGGGNFPEYAVHQIEMIVRTLGIGAKAVTCEKEFDKLVCKIEYVDERSATMIYFPFGSFGFMATDKDGKTSAYESVASPFFNRLIEEILKFYISGKPCFDTNETLEIMKIRELAVLAFEKA